MQTYPHEPHRRFPSAGRAIVYWTFHLIVICSMVLLGRYLGEYLVGIVLSPITPGDLTTEWWQIFQKFAATVIAGLFLAIVLGYVLLIWPQK